MRYRVTDLFSREDTNVVTAARPDAVAPRYVLVGRGDLFSGGARSARSTAATSGISAAIPAADSIGMRHRRDHARPIRRHAEVCEFSAPAR